MQSKKLLFPIMIVAILSRVLPHPLHFTAITSLCVLSYGRMSKSQSLLAIFASLLISDAALAYTYGWPIWGSWTIFTYSAFFVIIFAQHSYFQSQNRFKLFCQMPFASLFYWLWTNFGVWLSAGIYPLSWQGLSACYVAAIPFLGWSMLGDLFWFTVLLIGFQMAQRPVRMPNTS